MNKLNWFPFYVHDWLTSRKILHMTAGEEGAYFRLLCYAWTDKDCSLPNDADELKIMAKWITSTDGKWERVQRCFTKHPDFPKRLCNERLLAEWKKGHHITEVRRQAAQSRWNKPQDKPQRSILGQSKPQDRTSKGLTPISSEVHSVADKWFPPQ